MSSGESPRRNWADRLRVLRRLIGPIESAQTRHFGRSGLSVLLRVPVLVLETKGRRSGKVRSSTLSYRAEADGSWLVVAGSGGQTRLPDWAANLRACPAAVVVADRRRLDVRATEVTGAAQDDLWETLRTETPRVEVYARRAGRRAPVFRLVPMQDAGVDHSFAANRHRRALFSAAADTYERGRPGYPDRVYQLLTEVCGLAPGSRVVEIGPGTGQATGSLLQRGAEVTAIELGPELAERLRAKYAAAPLQVIVGAFEDVDLPAAQADLVVAATSFHWVPPEVALARSARLLREGGWLALWWSFFGDPDRPDPFHDALLPLLDRLAPSVLDVSSAGTVGLGPPYALDAAARIGEVERSGSFGPVTHEVIRWTGRHTAEEISAMFASFSPWLALAPSERAAALAALEALAREEFGGIVERPYLTPVYLARRQSRT